MVHPIAPLLAALCLLDSSRAVDAPEALSQAQPAPQAREAALSEASDYWFALQGGAGGYSAGLASLTSPGLSYGASFGFRPWRYLGIEAAYDGSRNGLQGRDGAVVRNSARILAKLFLGADPSFRAYLAGGAGIGHVYPTSGAALVDADVHLEVPLAFGVEWFRAPLFFGARLGLTGLFGDSFANRLATEPPEGAFVNGVVTFGLGF